MLGVAVLAEDSFNLQLDGRPVLDHVTASLSAVPAVLRVEVFRGSWLEALASVARADFDRVIFHAGDRPFFSSERLADLLGLARPHRVAVPADGVSDTYKVIRGGRIESTPKRERLVGLQAPWFFARSALEQLPRADLSGPGAISDLCLRHGLEIAIIPGHPANVRVRSTTDLDVIRWAWRQGL